MIGQEKEKELFNWLKLTWTQDTCPAAVLQTYCMPGTRKKGRNKEWDGLERYMKEVTLLLVAKCILSF